MNKIPSQIPVFFEVSKELSFSSAARNLGVTTAAVSKAITKLEEEWGLKLFQRSSHSLSLTHAGQELLHNLQPTVNDLFSVITAAQRNNQELLGQVKINLPSTSLGVDTILPHLKKFSDEHPGIKLDLRFNDNLVDLVSNGFDLGIGTYVNQDSRLIAKKLMLSRLGLFASKEFIAKHGQPHHPTDLSGYPCIPIRSTSSGKVRTIFLYDGETEISFTPTGPLVVDSFLAARALMMSGGGIAAITEWAIREELLSGDVVPVLEPFWGPKIPVYLYFSSREYMPHTTRTLINYLASITL
ncbi:LysR family transcriptional regulator [Vibrio hannami]|uniref:LysR family transcriptional regulator n=1 Tax=Vibrio hannami TaxID=2717094 RepID=UPI002410199F|nr:LysR family transcriptional regulator [Vibrio hannami]MDG3085554.1 LysR family transcriptional regulator [Vibrio hannami]